MILYIGGGEALMPPFKRLQRQKKRFMRSRKKIFLFLKKQKNLVHYVKVYKMLTFFFARRRLGGVFVRKSKGLSIILMFCDFSKLWPFFKSDEYFFFKILSFTYVILFFNFLLLNLFIVIEMLSMYSRLYHH